jgi:hypothetical protein
MLGSRTECARRLDAEAADAEIQHGDRCIDGQDLAEDLTEHLDARALAAFTSIELDGLLRGWLSAFVDHVFFSEIRIRGRTRTTLVRVSPRIL